MKKVKLTTNQKNTARLAIKGEYLRENGFEIGDIFSVYISPTEIIIKKGIHTGQNWLGNQFTVSRRLKTSVIRGMRWDPDSGSGEINLLKDKLNLPPVSDIKSKKEIDVTKLERDIEEYIPVITISNNIFINNGYNIGDYLNLDFVGKGEMRLTKSNVDNNIITNNFEYTKDIEVQIFKKRNTYFLSLIIILDRTIQSKTNFKEGDIVTVYIKDNIIYIKKGKENISNCYYHTIYKNTNSNTTTINIKTLDIFKQLNLEAGDFVTLKIVSPDILSLTKKDTGSVSNKQTPSINEINYIPMSYPLKNRELTKRDYINKANNYSNDGYLLKNIGYNKKDKYGFIDKINKLSPLISSKKYDELVNKFKFKETRINYYILWVLLLVKENKIDINSININELYDNLKKYDKIRFNKIKTNTSWVNDVRNLFNVNTLELNYDYESLKNKNTIEFNQNGVLPVNRNHSDKIHINNYYHYMNIDNIMIYHRVDSLLLKYFTDDRVKPLIYELDFKNRIYKFNNIEYNSDILFNINKYRMDFISTNRYNKIFVNILNEGNIYHILLPFFINNCIYDYNLLKLIPERYITNGLVKNCIDLNPNFLNDFRKLNLYNDIDEKELTYPEPPINSNDDRQYIPYDNTNKINENKLSSYIRKVIRQIINENFK